MIAIAVASLLLLALITGIVGLVVVGLEGRGSERHPRLRTRLTQLARHLNGDGNPPPTFLRLLRKLHLNVG